jgi:hypothetical protein
MSQPSQSILAAKPKSFETSRLSSGVDAQAKIAVPYGTAIYEDYYANGTGVEERCACK